VVVVLPCAGSPARALDEPLDFQAIVVLMDSETEMTYELIKKGSGAGV